MFRCLRAEVHQSFESISFTIALSPAPETLKSRALPRPGDSLWIAAADKRQQISGSMVNNKKNKGKHRQPKTTNLFVPPAAPKQPVPKKYGLDYSRFDVDSDDSDAERQALAAPETLRTGRAPPPDPKDVRDLERELGAHVSSLSAAEAAECARSRGEEMDKLKQAAPNDRKSVHEEVSQREPPRAAPSPRPGPSSKPPSARRPTRAGAEAAESVSKRSSDVRRPSAGPRSWARSARATAAIDPEQLKAGLSPDAPSAQPGGRRPMTARSM